MAKKPTTKSDTTITTAPVRTASKKSRLIGMLSRDGGTTIAKISAALGWLPHTTRAALTGLRKTGYEISAEKPDNGKLSRYRITARPAGDTA